MFATNKYSNKATGTLHYSVNSIPFKIWIFAKFHRVFIKRYKKIFYACPIIVFFQITKGFCLELLESLFNFRQKLPNFLSRNFLW